MKKKFRVFCQTWSRLDSVFEKHCELGFGNMYYIIHLEKLLPFIKINFCSNLIWFLYLSKKFCCVTCDVINHFFFCQKWLSCSTNIVKKDDKRKWFLFILLFEYAHYMNSFWGLLWIYLESEIEARFHY